jgi:hypothetical protein
MINIIHEHPLRGPATPLFSSAKALENTLQKLKIPNSIGSPDSRINSSPFRRDKIQNGQLVGVCTHSLPLPFLSYVWNV